MQIFRFVVTGGPCGGKTTALAHVRRYFEEKGIGVVTVPETATELISSGISPRTVGSSFVYQSVQLRLQAEKLWTPVASLRYNPEQNGGPQPSGSALSRLTTRLRKRSAFGVPSKGSGT